MGKSLPHSNLVKPHLSNQEQKHLNNLNLVPNNNNQ